MLVCDFCRGEEKVQKIRIDVREDNSIHFFKQQDLCKNCLAAISTRLKRMLQRVKRRAN